MTKKNKRKAFAAAGSACGLLACGGLGLSAYAAYAVASNTQNYVTTPAFGADIVEDYTEPPEGVHPGDEVTKEVSVANTGTTPELVRVSLEKKIGIKDADGNLEHDESFDKDKIILNMDLETWMDGGDGWYYYKGVLEPDSETTKLLKSFTLSPDMTDDYQSLDCQIIVDAETIQFGGGSEEAWGISLADLGVEWNEDGYEAQETSVAFLGESEKFDIELSKTDLFANFKDVLPGSSRTQSINISNQSKDTVTMGLDSMELDLDEKRIIGDSEKVKAFMMEYASAKVADQDGNIVYEGPVGGQGQCDIDLGEFAPGESKKLNVTLTVDPGLDEESQALMGCVTWEFSASMADKPDEPVKQWLTKTSDLGLLKLGLILVGAGIVGAAASKAAEKVSDKKAKARR